jgi:hypothetical protein
MMMMMSMACNYVPHLWPPVGLFFIPQVIYELGEPWRYDVNRGKLLSSTRALWQSYQQSHLVASRRNGQKE